MRKHLTRIAILAVCSLGFIGITGAAPASAANCNADFLTNVNGQTIWYDSGYLYFQAYLHNCTGVSEIMMAGAPVDYYQGFWTGLHDQTTGIIHQVTRPPFPDTVTFIMGGKTHAEYNWGIAPWCAPQTTHSVYARYVWKLKNSVGGTWGIWHATTSPNYNIWC